MAILTFKIEYTDGTTEEAPFRPKAQVAYERETGDAIGMDEDQILVTKVYRMAWYAAGQPLEDFDAWIDTIDGVTSLGDDDDTEEGGDTFPT